MNPGLSSPSFPLRIHFLLHIYIHTHKKVSNTFPQLALGGGRRRATFLSTKSSLKAFTNSSKSIRPSIFESNSSRSLWVSFSVHLRIPPITSRGDCCIVGEKTKGILRTSRALHHHTPIMQMHVQVRGR